MANCNEEVETLQFKLQMVPLAATTQGQKKLDLKPCLFEHTQDPSSTAETQVSSVFVVGKFEESIDFSSLEDKVVTVFGGDKGSTMTTMLTHSAN